MVKLKPSWKKTNYSPELWIELVSIMRWYHTYRKWYAVVVDSEDIQKLARKSLNTNKFEPDDGAYADLKKDVKRIPFDEVMELPEKVQGFIMDQRPDLQEEIRLAPREGGTPGIVAESLKNHWSKLSQVAEKLQGYLRSQKSICINSDQLIIDAAQHIEGTLAMEISALFDEALLKQLLEHIQEEDDLPQLQGISSWWELKAGDITDELLNRLSIRAAESRFKGVCAACSELVAEIRRKHHH